MLQSGARCIGVGLGAGVGGDAGAEGRRLCGRVEETGDVGVCIGRGCERDMTPRFREREVGEVLKRDGAAEDRFGDSEMSCSVLSCMSMSEVASSTCVV